MIGAVSGNILLIKKDSLVVMAGHVGYTIAVPLQLLSTLGPNTEILLYTYTHVREDTLQLFGFKTSQELELFELLLTVSGVGPKTALAIIDRGVEQIRKAVVEADVAFFTSIPRLGSKNAQKVIIELKPKLGSLHELDLLGQKDGETEELVNALMSVGFSKVESINVIKTLPPELISLEDKIRASLKILGRKKI